MSIEVYFSETKLKFPFGIAGWIQSIKTKIQMRILTHLDQDTTGMDRYLECVEISELPGAYLCSAFYQRDMNDVFTRMGLFMGAGKGIKKFALVPQEDHTLANYKKLVAGHNLPGSIVTAFAQAANDASEFESAFLKPFLEKVAEKKEKFYLIAFSIQNMKSHQNVISHEIFHAQYYLNNGYNKVVNEFWQNDVTKEDKALIYETLGKAYNTDDEDLIIDEFQAYLLQQEAGSDRLRALVEKHKSTLEAQLKKAGVKLLLF
jgi:hypothetical protein